MACVNYKYLRLCCDNNIFIYACDTAFDDGEVYYDSNGYCWEVMGSSGYYANLTGYTLGSLTLSTNCATCELNPQSPCLSSDVIECIQYSSTTYTNPSLTCPGYFDSFVDYTFWLTDGLGNTIINYGNTIEVTLSGTVTPYGSFASPWSTTGQILNSFSSVTVTVTTIESNDFSPGCPCPCQTTISVDDFFVSEGIVNGVCAPPPSPTPTPSPTPIPCNAVTGLNVNGTTILGEPTLDIFISLQNVVTQDTIFGITVQTSNYGLVYSSITVLNGNSSANLTYGLGGLGAAPSVDSSCVNSVDNNSISCTSFQCSAGVCPCVDAAPTPTPTQTPTNTPTPTLTPSNTGTPGASPTGTPTETPTNTLTPTLSPTNTLTPSNTATPGSSPTQTPTNTPTETPTLTPSNTATPGSSPTQTPTNTPTETPTLTPTNTITPTYTPTLTSTPTPTTTEICDIITCANRCCEVKLLNETGSPIGYSYYDCNGSFVSSSLSGGAGITICLDQSYGVLSAGSITVYDWACCAGPPPTPSNTPTVTPTETPTNTPTPTPTNTLTPTLTSSNTPTPTPTATPSASNTPTPTPTPTNTLTPTNTTTPTLTSTPIGTLTPTQTPTPTTITLVQFQDCSDINNVFRYNDPILTNLTIGTVYYIVGGPTPEFEGCATIVAYTGAGPIHNGAGVTFIEQTDCGDTLCPVYSYSSALLVRCSDLTIFYGLVRTDTSFPGAVYLYNGECYRFEEFSGDGGPNLGNPVGDGCGAAPCLPTPTPTATPAVSPSPTPTVTPTEQPCPFSAFCFRTTLSSLSGYSGNYTSTGSVYNGELFYTGDGINQGVIYYFTSATESYWCLAAGSSPGGACLLQGASPCFSNCPDFTSSDFSSGICPSPTPTIDCAAFDFNAYFDCDYTPPVTPSVSIPCDTVGFDVTGIAVSPTPTPSKAPCIVGLSFSLSAYTPSLTPTVTIGPTPTPTKTVPADGQVTFTMMDTVFSCVSVKVIQDCKTQELFYTSDNITFNGAPVIQGQYFLAIINGTYRCMFYKEDSENISSNTNVSNVVQVFAICDSCSPNPPATPTPTNTPTTTITPTITKTPTITPTTTPTQTPTATIGSIPPSATPTTTMTPTITPTITISPSFTPTVTPTPSWNYVFTSCEPIGFNLTRTVVIQTLPTANNYTVGAYFKDQSNNCWQYNGIFPAGSYIAPSGFITQNYSGDFFSTAGPLPFVTCLDCQQIIIPPFGCTLVYFNATRCDTSESIVVAACDLGPCYPLGSIPGLFCVTPQVGQYHAITNPTGDDYCVLLTSTASPTTNYQTIATPAYSNLPGCGCSLYDAYLLGSCDGSIPQVQAFRLAGSPVLSVGQGVLIDTQGICFQVTAYLGKKNVYPFLPGISPLIVSTYLDCPECITVNTGGGGGGGGGGGTS